MARLINLYAAAGRRMALRLFRFLSEYLFFHQTDYVLDYEPRRGLLDLLVEILLYIRILSRLIHLLVLSSIIDR
jgi:hypothetical protein